MDGKGPGKPGDAARHGLKSKSPSELRKIRSSDSASPRKKQLAHWLLNFVHKEETQTVQEEGGAGEEGTKKLKDKYKKETPEQ